MHLGQYLLTFLGIFTITSTLGRRSLGTAYLYIKACPPGPGVLAVGPSVIFSGLIETVNRETIYIAMFYLTTGVTRGEKVHSKDGVR